MTVAIIDYGSGNLRSAAKAFERAAGESGLDTPIRVTADSADLAAAERVVLPGVGAFADCMAGLDALPGMHAALDREVVKGGKPFLGICVGMQLMAERGFEHGSHGGLGWLPGDVVALEPDDPALKVPHMGWNELEIERAHPVLEGIEDGDHAYFVHGYQMRCADHGHCVARAEYGGTVTAVVARDNMIGTQFHPEKSQAVGLKLIANFLNWCP